MDVEYIKLLTQEVELYKSYVEILKDEIAAYKERTDLLVELVDKTNGRVKGAEE